jgi:hypothetical protein
LVYCLTNEGKIRTDQGNEEGEAGRCIARGISWINEVDKDIGSVAVGGQVDQRDENSEEAKSMDD